MEDGLNSYLPWQLQAVGRLTFADNLFDLQWSHAFDVQFVRRTVRADIATVEPDMVSNLELWHGFHMTIMVGFVLGLDVLQVIVEYSVELTELFNKAFSGGINRPVGMATGKRYRGW